MHIMQTQSYIAHSGYKDIYKTGVLVVLGRHSLVEETNGSLANPALKFPLI